MMEHFVWHVFIAQHFTVNPTIHIFWILMAVPIFMCYRLLRGYACWFGL